MPPEDNQQAPAPVQAPAAPLDIGTAPPAAAPAPVAPPPAAGDTQAYRYPSTGNPSLDTVYGYLGDRGFSPEHPAVVAAKAGDFNRMRADLAALGDKAPAYQAVVALAETVYANEQAADRAAADATRKVVHEAVGGEENWGAIREWAKSNATPEEAQGINGALALGGLAAKAAALYLSQLYSGRPPAESSQAPDSPLRNTPSAQSAGASERLDSAAFKAEYNKLVSKYGSRAQQTPEYRDIVRRRTMA